MTYFEEAWLNFKTDIDGHIQMLEGEVVILRGENINLSERNIELEQQIVALQIEIERLKALVNDQLTTTLFGQSPNIVTGDWDSRTEVARIFLGGISQNESWYDPRKRDRSDGTRKNDLQVSYEAGIKTVVLSWKEDNVDNVRQFLRTKPDDVKVYGCYHHEPENGDFPDPQVWRDNWERMSVVIREAGCIPTAILMGYTFKPASGRDLNDWVLPKDTIDVLGIDTYGYFNYNLPEEQGFLDILDVCAANEWGWGIGEIGALVGEQDRTYEDRAEWAGIYRNYCIENEAAFACWFDRVHRHSNPPRDFTLDPLTASAWYDV